jgi:hypothetical protein
MNAHLRSGLRTGMIFGIILVFLVLIGFQATIADLLGSLLHDNAFQTASGFTPAMLNMMIFFGLIGLWAGAGAARPVKATSKLYSLTGGLVAGAAAGFLLGLLAIILGSLDAAGIKVSTYLAQLLPAAIHVFTLQQSPQQAGLVYFVLLMVTG